jgi:hypothetical protein
METAAALFREIGAPLSVEPIALDPPRPTEVLVRVGAVGLCRTDYHVMRGERRVAMQPMVLGHEAAGVVEDVGAEVAGMRRLPLVPAGAAPSLRRRSAHYERAATRRQLSPARPRRRGGRRFLYGRRFRRTDGRRSGVGRGDRQGHPA